MTYRAKVYVTLKEGVLDPQGNAVRQGLNSLGHSVQDVRVGRFIVLTLEAEDEASAKAQVEEMCRRLLANPVIEDYTFDTPEEV